MITILGPTASGKTTLAAHLAYTLGGEVISADSRQVYKGMDIGTGKDIGEYIVAGHKIRHHLIDIANPGDEYSVYEFLRGFHLVYDDLISRNRQPLLCGGSGMYIESVLKGYDLPEAPESQSIRAALEQRSDMELIEILKQFRSIHNTTDTLNRERLMRALEIAMQQNVDAGHDFGPVNSIIFGIHYERTVLRERITARLEERLRAGMTDEVRQLLATGVPAEKLKFYGLEYRFLTQHILGELNYSDMFQKLNTAIHQFAKRQMTWFRRMERHGFHIHWIDGQQPLQKKIGFVREILESQNPL